MNVQYVVAAGDPETQNLPPEATTASVIAADGGADLALALGLRVDLVIGDLDSITQRAKSLLQSRDKPFVRLDPDKDLTDLEAALELAVGRLDAQLSGDPKRIVVIGGHGGRLDHLAGNLAAFDSVPGDISLEAWMGTDVLFVVRSRLDVALNLGSTVSILARTDSIVTTQNLLWPLNSYLLRPDSTLGLSNRSTGQSVSIEVESGLCHVIVPNSKDAMK